jgi:hypothetical protein
MLSVEDRGNAPSRLNNSQLGQYNVISIHFLNMNQHQSTTTLIKFLLDAAAAPTLPWTQYTENSTMR